MTLPLLHILNSKTQLVDFAPFLASTASTELRKVTAKSVLNAFRSHGFIYLTNHGISEAEVENAFRQSAHFFDLPLSKKTSLPWTGARSNRGYSAMGEEKVSNLATNDENSVLREQVPDLKESFEIGRENEAGCPNLWPLEESCPRFKDDAMKLHAACAHLHTELLRAIALALDIDEHWFDSYTRQADNTLRLLHYPRVRRDVFDSKKKRAEAEGQVRAGAHTDYGSLTLLFQDDRGGLQVEGVDGKGWIDVKPIAGTIVVNAADLLARWTNDLIRSTPHRVVEPPPVVLTSDASAGTPVTDLKGKEEYYPARYSIAYFANPDFDRDIDVVPGTVAEGESKKYETVNSGVYLEQRIAATY